ncbi:hypothetical protein HETIRDRAFT_305747 [Heterobasidion irregulare TC 32-1]|uniref:Uncharacterized protein n=1 Tax=Heterobasidion irregulare (strain TC 32-1) TaxID=747525 RepID=W4KM32_HETIT|nr:uncharacterized protein HETIRDRAFT_305747 [Heterobasidion irregulare TC 32-1]ETW86430.1 hypothetical protein HETIRDRAFT_305747 [Heterobasidion irregulare TC 32-1]
MSRIIHHASACNAAGEDASIFPPKPVDSSFHPPQKNTACSYMSQSLYRS